MRLTPRFFDRPRANAGKISRREWWRLFPRPWSRREAPAPAATPDPDGSPNQPHPPGVYPGWAEVSLLRDPVRLWALLDRYDGMMVVPEYLRRFNDDLSVTAIERRHETNRYWITPHEVRDRLYADPDKERSVMNPSRGMSMTPEERYHERMEARVAHPDLARSWSLADGGNPALDERLDALDRRRAWELDFASLSPARYLDRNRRLRLVAAGDLDHAPPRPRPGAP